MNLLSDLWIFFTFQQGLAPSCRHVRCQFLCQPQGRGSKVMLVFLEEKLKARITHSSLTCKFSDQIQKCPIQINKVKMTGHSDFLKINMFA